MRNLKSLLYGALALTALGFAACQDDIDAPSVEQLIPSATKTANTTILELKTLYWDDEQTNYIDTIGYVYNDVDDITGTTAKYPRNADGSRKTYDRNFIIKGRVISSDEDGNVFKSLYIQDETAALTVSINTYNLYLTYRIGQEVVIDLKGMYIGKYSGLLQLGYPQYSESYGWQTTFMSREVFQAHAEANGLPQPSKVDTLTYNTIAEMPTGNAVLMQSQLIRLNNVHFEDGGKEVFSEYQSSGINRTVVDSEGNSLSMRTSGYASFWNMTLPEGDGDIVCLLGYHSSGGYQLVLISPDGLLNFGNPTVAPGTESRPYNVDQVIERVYAGLNAQGWVTGYIVGAVKPEVTSITSNDDIQWTATPDLPYTLVIGATPETKDITSCLVVELPEDTRLEEYGNLVSNPGNYKKEITIKGVFGMFMDTFGITYTSGKKSDFRIEGVEVPDDGSGAIASGDGSAEHPFNCADAVAKAQETGQTATSQSYYIKGFVVEGSIDTSYGNATFKLADTAGGTASFVAYRFLSFNGAKFTDANLIKVGDVIVVYAPIVNYMGNTPETTQGGKLISINGGTSGGDTPDTPTTDPSGAGTEASPFNCAAAVAKCIEIGTTASTEKYYVEGYVISGSIDTSYGNATFKLADTAGGEATFTAFRFYDYGGEKFTDASKIKVGDKIVVKGALVNYYGNTPETAQGGELISVNSGSGSGSGSDDPVVNPGTGAGTEANPYDVASVIAKNPQGNGDAPDESNVWVKGYIVGWADMSSTYYINAETARFTVPATLATNILLADSPTCKDVAQCIGIQLPSGAVRSALNLKDNPGNLGKLVSLKGNIAKYSGVAGLRSVSAYLFDGETPSTPSDPTEGAAGAGTEASPFNCAAAVAKCVEIGTTASTEKYYVEGYVISGSIDTTYGNATFKMADAAGAEATFTAFRFYDYGGEKFTDASKIKVGDKIVVKGSLINYYGNSPEITTGGELISINGATE